MHDLSAIDAAFLYAENTRAPMHVAALQIYDPGTAAAPVCLNSLIEQIADRAHLIDCFRFKLVETPWHLDYPHWVDDPEFDVRRHVFEEVLPAPGDWPTLCRTVARLVQEPLPRNRPLWEMRLIRDLHGIEDFPEGAFAIVTKIHHAAVDGVAGIGVTAVLHDLEPQPGSALQPPPQHDEKRPSAASLAINGLLKEMLRPLRVYQALPALNRLTASLPLVPGVPAPQTRINRRLSADRAFDALHMPLTLLRQSRHLVSDATVNDVLLAIIGGAMRRYLSHHGELPQRSLTALVPMSTHTGPQLHTGNEIAQLTSPLGTDIADFTTRLRKIQASTIQAKAAARQVDARAVDTVAALAPAALVEFAVKTAPQAAVLPFNTVVTNVKGPPVPFYLCGAKLVRGYGMGPLADRLGVFHTVLSYMGDVSLSVLACESLVPDLGFYMTCLRDELAVMEQAVEAHPA